jgi:hypothetical protein
MEVMPTALAAAIVAFGAACAPMVRPIQPSPVFNPAASQETKNASLRTFLLCIIRAETQMDDHISDAQTIALALTERCMSAYTSVTADFEPMDNSHVRAMWIEQRNSREAKIEASLDTVLSMRRGYVLNPNPEGPLLVSPTNK